MQAYKCSLVPMQAFLLPGPQRAWGRGYICIIDALHSLLYPNLTCLWLQGLPFHIPIYNSLTKQVCMYLDLHDRNYRMQHGASEVSPPAFIIYINFLIMIIQCHVISLQK